MPNLLTCARLVLVPVTIYALLNGQMLVAFALFVLAGVTDAVDGAIARAFDARTELGARLDPVADKALLVGCYIALGYLGLLPQWLVILVVLRDVLILGAALAYYLSDQLVVKPIWISKLNTLGQIVLAALVMGGLGFGLDVAGVQNVLVIVVALTTAASGVAYFWGAAKKASQGFHN